MTYPAFPKPVPSVKNKKTKEWASARADLDKEFEAMGIDRCELELPSCWKNKAMGYAHPDKRRNIKPKDIKKNVIKACGSCHNWLEFLPRPMMKEIILLVIKNRK